MPLTSQKLRVSGTPDCLMNPSAEDLRSLYGNTQEKGGPVARAILATVESRFRPEKAEGVTMNIGYDLTGENGGQWDPDD